MVQYTMVKADKGKMLMAVEPQPFYRGDLIIAEDVRGHFLFISQSMSGIRAGIEAVCHQVVSLTSLHESARREIRGGRTGGSWNVMRMERDVAIAHYNSVRGRFAHHIIAARRPSAWKFCVQPPT